MGAYAALLSVMRIINQLQNHPHPPISLLTKQVDSLTKKLDFLQKFLEHYNPHEVGYSTEADPLESRIADAAYAAEDVIESHIVDQITNHGENFSLDGLYRGLEKVIEAMDSLEKEAIEIEETNKEGRHQLLGNSTPLDSLRYSSTMQQNSSMAMVGVDDVLYELKDKLTRELPHHLQIIPIVGMGGTGKSTLARNIYEEPFIKEHFYIRAWATISQEYSIREIFNEFFRDLSVEDGQNLSEDVLGEKLYKHLWGRKYLIIMDDMWSIDAWDGVRRFFPDNKNGSKIVVTTRLSNLFSVVDRLEMRLLDEANSWDLLSKTVFRENDCPIELEEIGKKIGKSCKGLPLSIVVVGGLLAMSKQTVEFWDYIVENLNSIVNLEDNKRCLKILHMSYKQLPMYLKPCFLYMGVFPEDEVISISRLSKLLVAEGFVKPMKGKLLEGIAKEYLRDLIDRNLILIHEMGSTGNIKKCKIHDLLRDFCLGEAEKERFYTYVTQGVRNTQRRVVISSASEKEAIDCLQSLSLARSLIWCGTEKLPPLSSRLLRIYHSIDHSFPYQEDLLELVNLRYIVDCMCVKKYNLLSLYQLWNLETLIVEGVIYSKCTFPAEIWYMTQIRHVKLENVYLPDPPSSRDDDIMLGHLQTLGTVSDFKCSEEVVRRIPNVNKLGIIYIDEQVEGMFCLNNLECLDKLESLNCSFFININLRGPESLSFPHSLKKLNLRIDDTQYWQDILEKIGALPLLEKLQLTSGCFEACKWETVEGQFRRLKYLKISSCEDLEEWTTESSHFPCLEHLVLSYIHGLTEIPLDVADISTLQFITLKYCNTSAVISAKGIVEKQEELYGEVALQIRVILEEMQLALEGLASPNIRVEIDY